jgi:thiol-disulfide isomerase/thioredoxin/tetratricopeptide (TPR) repeat protein
MSRKIFSYLAVLCMAAQAANGQAGVRARNEVLDRVSEERERGQVRAADLVARYQASIQKDPQNPQHYVEAAAVFPSRQSERLFRQAIELAPDYLPAHLGFARCEVRMNALAALGEYQKAIALAPNDVPLRAEAVSQAGGAMKLADLRRLAGDDRAGRIELVRMLLSRTRLDDAAAELGELEKAGADVAALQAELLARRGAQAKDQKLSEQGVEQLLALWKQDLKGSGTPRVSASTLARYLTTAHRPEAVEVLAEGARQSPDDYTLRQELWKARFAEPKGDYSAEKSQVRAESDVLMKSPHTKAQQLEAAAVGYQMAGDEEDRSKAQQQLLAEFPYSESARSVRLEEAMKAKDPRKKVELLRSMNRDFFTTNFSGYSLLFGALAQANATDEELATAAEDYVNDCREMAFPTMMAIPEISTVYLQRKSNLDQMQHWLDQEQPGWSELVKKPQLSRNDAALLLIRAKTLVAQGKPKDAEPVLRHLIEVSTEPGGRTAGETEHSLADALLAQDHRDEARELYGKAYVHTGHGDAAARTQFLKLFQESNGKDADGEGALARLEPKRTETPSDAHEIRVNEPAPSFDMVRLDGTHVTLASLKGKTVVINFWATWCGPCRREMPEFEKYYEQVKSNPSVLVLAVTIDENRALVAPFLKNTKYTFPVLYDDGLFRKLKFAGVPSTVIIDPKGNVRARVLGFLPDDNIVDYLTKTVNQYSHE